MTALPIWLRGYRARAVALVAQPRVMAALLDKALALSSERGAVSAAVASVRADLEACIALLGATIAGRYPIPYSSITLLAAALLYFVMPADLVPDLIPGAGLLDDAAMITLVASRLSAELSGFRRWQQQA